MLPGGFVGVDVFFVISGFLITRILLVPGGTSLATFYARRIRRIFPALIAVLLATYAIGWVILLPPQFRLLGENIVASVLFASNLFQLGQAGYFAPLAAENPLLHLWSLGVEEQFYIFWPLALGLLARSPRRRQYILGAIALSLAAGVALAATNPDWGFYAPLPRAWELLIGGLVAEANLVRKGSSNLLGAIGLGAIAASALLFDRAMPFPGALALLPVVGAALVIVVAECRGQPRAVVEQARRAARPHQLPALSLALAAADLSRDRAAWGAEFHRDLGRGSRRDRAVDPDLPLYRMAGPPSAQRGAGLVDHTRLRSARSAWPSILSAGFVSRFPQALQAIATVSTDDNPAFRDHCFLEAPGSRFRCELHRAGRRAAAAAMGRFKCARPSIRRVAEAATTGFVPGRALQCAGLRADPRCGTECILHRKQRQGAMALIEASRPDIVVLHAMWGFDNDLNKLGATIAALRSAGISRVIIVGPPPVWKRTLPHAIINHYRFSHELPERLGAGVSGPAEDELMADFGKSAGVGYVSLRKVLCDPRQQCLVRTPAGEVIADRYDPSVAGRREAGARTLSGRDLFRPAGAP